MERAWGDWRNNTTFQMIYVLPGCVLGYCLRSHLPALNLFDIRIAKSEGRAFV